MKVGQSFKHQEKTKESLAIQAKAELSEGMRHALTDPEDGMLRPGALPKLQGVSSAGSKKLLESVAAAKAGLSLWSETGMGYGLYLLSRCNTAAPPSRSFSILQHVYFSMFYTSAFPHQNIFFALTNIPYPNLRDTSTYSIPQHSLCWYPSLLNTMSVQVVAAPKKKKEKTESEDMKPATWESKATDQLPEMLNASATARTISIKLAGIEYADELSKKMKDHANDLEDEYHKLSKSLKEKASEKALKTSMERIQDKLAFGIKAQVWCEENLFLRSCDSIASILLQVL